MKKIIFSIIPLFILFLATGCGSDNTKVLKCSGVTQGNNMNAVSNIKYTFKNDKLSKANIEVEFKDITVDNLASLWGTFKNQFTEQNKPVDEIGFKRTVNADDKEYTFTIDMEIDFDKISKETMEKYDIEDYRLKSYDEIKKDTTSDGKISCE